MVFHVLNRGNDRREIFDDRGDYEAFLRVMQETQQRVAMRVLAYCLLPNHWHLLLWPAQDGDLGAFMQRWVNEPQTKQELGAIRLSVNRGQPFGNDDWQKRTAARLRLEFTLHPRGRPRKDNALP
jgi:REP element-mobilizing transposase RayT